MTNTYEVEIFEKNFATLNVGVFFLKNKIYKSKPVYMEYIFYLLIDKYTLKVMLLWRRKCLTISSSVLEVKKYKYAKYLGTYVMYLPILIT